MQCLCGSGVLDWWDVPELKISQFNFLFKRPTSTAPIALSSQQSVDGGEKTLNFSPASLPLFSLFSRM